MANDTNKIKLLVLWDILCKNTDENHAMNSDEIREELAKRGISVMRKVVATDIAALNKYGYEVLSYKKKYYYYYVVSRPLETAEVVMLADVIKASKLTSMIDIGIKKDDLVVIRKQNTADDGEIVVAMINGETTLKRIFRRNGKVILHPENKEMKDIVVKDCEIQGVLVSCIKIYD